jgi:hypothetical protein
MAAFGKMKEISDGSRCGQLQSSIPTRCLKSYFKIGKYKVVQIWQGQTVTCLHTNNPGHIWTTLCNWLEIYEELRTLKDIILIQGVLYVLSHYFST